MMDLELTTMPFIIMSVYILTEVLKTFVLKTDAQRKCLPVIAAILGGAIAIALFIFMPETTNFSDIINAVTDGMASGFAAVGCNQVYKQFKRFKTIEDSEEDI